MSRRGTSTYANYARDCLRSSEYIIDQHKKGNSVEDSEAERRSSAPERDLRHTAPIAR
jgi:hypothetical protein